MAVIFWACATFVAMILLAVCATSWYIALQQQREGSRVPYSRYWSAPAPKNQDMT
jgi:hypothetical protein